MRFLRYEPADMMCFVIVCCVQLVRAKVRKPKTSWMN